MAWQNALSPARDQVPSSSHTQTRGGCETKNHRSRIPYMGLTLSFDPDFHQQKWGSHRETSFKDKKRQGEEIRDTNYSAKSCRILNAVREQHMTAGVLAPPQSLATNATHQSFPFTPNSVEMLILAQDMMRECLFSFYLVDLKPKWWWAVFLIHRYIS